MKKYLPSREQLKNTKSLQFLGDRIFEPNLWHFNRYSLSLAAFVGGMCCFLPIPFQMIPCVFICIAVRCNIPLAVAIVWVSNPITMGPMMYFAYLVGSWMLGTQLEVTPLEPSLDWFLGHLAEVWQPLILGCFFCGLVTGTVGFVAIRLYYRWRIYRYKERKRRKKAAGDDSITPI